jgi:hypothetical protein
VIQAYIARAAAPRQGGGSAVQLGGGGRGRARSAPLSRWVALSTLQRGVSRGGPARAGAPKTPARPH